MYKQGDTIALPVGLAGRGYIAVSTVFGRNVEGQSTLLIEVSRSSLWRTDYWRYSSWHVKLVHHSKHCLVCWLSSIFLYFLQTRCIVFVFQTCWYCKKSGATVGCCMSRCKKVFHLPCGRREGSLHQFFGQFK
jgi:hypothetical protein